MEVNLVHHIALEAAFVIRIYDLHQFAPIKVNKHIFRRVMPDAFPIKS